ncbi:GM14769 [Drosophila sechellia]|uniref:GM14769 n=1 Tax=Drosophila sechellia TaxID=7238 RepID=B4HUS0_DROSE|nr:GM14769 [Drosophila sechellia]
MEQPDKEVQALEAEVKVLNTELALQNAGNRRNRLKREIAELEEVMEKQRIALESNSPSDNEGSSEDFDLDEE